MAPAMPTPTPTADGDTEKFRQELQVIGRLYLSALWSLTWILLATLVGVAFWIMYHVCCVDDKTPDMPPRKDRRSGYESLV